MEMSMNLLKTEKYEDGKSRYVGMYYISMGGPLVGGPELFYLDPKKLFEELRRTFEKEIKVIVRSEKLPPELSRINWFAGRTKIKQSELLRIVEEQKEEGYDVELTAHA